MIVEFSSDLAHFDQTLTVYDHYSAELVEFHEEVLAIGADSHAMVEQFSKQRWIEHQMSPVGGLTRLHEFSAIAVDNDLFIFGSS